MTPQAALSALAIAQEDLMRHLKLDRFAPSLNEKKSAAYWLNQPGAPKKERPAPKPRTISYEELIKRWEQ